MAKFRYFIFCLLSFSFGAYALDQPDSLSSGKLCDDADLIVLVTITSGEVKSASYKVLGCADNVLKEKSSHTELKIHFEKSVLFDSPTKLGGTYLVHLKKGGDDLFFPVAISWGHDRSADFKKRTARY